jgi:hypothetical protein
MAAPQAPHASPKSSQPARPERITNAYYPLAQASLPEHWPNRRRRRLMAVYSAAA